MRLLITLITLSTIFLGGCSSHLHNVKAYKFEKPRIAVLDFENKVSMNNRWQLSEGMRDMLVDALVSSNRYTVLSRNDLGAVINELNIQDSSYFREEGKLKQNKLKNVEFLIKGAVTDFAHTKGGTLRVLGSNLLGIGGSGEVAVVSVTLYVINVETGEIVASKTMQGTASAGSIEFNALYDDVALGGKAFFRTPLGKATQEVLEDCLYSISTAIANKNWYPTVVKADNERVILSGGNDRRINIGSEWSAFVEGEELIDPKTGDVLGREEGHLSGLIRVTEVYDKYSVAETLKGTFYIGQSLRAAILPEKTANSNKPKNP